MKKNYCCYKERYASCNLKQCNISARRCVNADNENLMCEQDKEKNINYGCVDDMHNIIYLHSRMIEFRITVVK